MATAPTAQVTLSLPEGDASLSGKVLPDGVCEYLGVMYAEIAEGEKAFEAPQELRTIPPEQQDCTKEVDKPLVNQPDLCMFCCAGCAPCIVCGHCMRSTNEGGNGPAGASTDQLRLNVWTPPAKGPAPVMVWIHGGGDAGSSRTDDPNSRNGSKLCAQGVVVCTVGFRQGIFGVMDWGPGSDVPVNLELRDLVAALRWVQRHIGAFGGDPANVTIFGESIGARRVAQLVYCQAAAGLFHKAIASSPSALDTCNVAAEHHALRRQLVLKYLRMDDSGAQRSLSKADLLKVPRQQLMNAQTAVKGGMQFLPGTRLSGAPPEDVKLFASGAQVPWTMREWARAGFGFLGLRTVDGLRVGWDASVLDGDLMTAPVGEGSPAEVPLLLMFEKDEYTALGLFRGTKPRDVKTRDHAVELLRYLLPLRKQIPEARATRIAAEYLDAYAGSMSGASLSEVYTRAAQELWQYHCVVTMARRHADAHGGRAKAFVAMNAYDCGDGKTPHGADVSFMFGLMPPLPIHGKGKDLDGITRIMQASIVSFASTGHPNTGGDNAVSFMPYDPANPKMTLLDSQIEHQGSENDARRPHGCRVVDTFGASDKIYANLLAALRAAESES